MRKLFTAAFAAAAVLAATSTADAEVWWGRISPYCYYDLWGYLWC